MGEVADSLINGEFDYVTGEYIGEPCGYPRRLPVENIRKSLRKSSETKVEFSKRAMQSVESRIAYYGIEESTDKVLLRYAEKMGWTVKNPASIANMVFSGRKRQFCEFLECYVPDETISFGDCEGE